MDTNEQPEKPHAYRYILIFFLWVAFSLIIVVLGYPHVKKSIESSGVLPLLQQRQSATINQSRTRSVYVYFIALDGKLQEFTVTQDRLGGNVYHDTFEALLSGANEEILKQGSASYIHPKTKLIGLTVSNRILYLNLSEEYLLSQDKQKAFAQLKATAIRSGQIKDMVLLVEGKVIE